jgi:trehalose-phosphatase
MTGPRHLLAAWDEVEQRLRRAETLALLTDFDGTLAPIRRTPDQAHAAPRVRNLLASIAKTGAVVGIVSGRSLKDLRAKVQLRGLWYVGEHGYAAQPPAGPAVSFHDPRQASAMRNLRRELAGLRRLAGVLLEPKTATLAIHYRNAPTRVAAKTIATVRRAVRAHRRLRLLRGKMVLEVLPDSRVTKWTAIDRIMKRQASRRRTLLLYLGDDVTDEAVFERMTGISIMVGRRRRTAARYYLSSPAEVRQFLRRLSSIRSSQA